MTARDVARLLLRVRKGPGCWEWEGAHNSKGYGNFTLKKDGRHRWVGAHRAVYEVLRGPIPEDHEIDHLCLNKGCVNPQHMEPVPREGRINSVRYQAAKTHCPQGHPYDEANTYRQKLPSGTLGRSCKICRNRHASDSHRRRRERERERRAA